LLHQALCRMGAALSVEITMFSSAAVEVPPFDAF
jgi:hypothetical protein